MGIFDHLRRALKDEPSASRLAKAVDDARRIESDAVAEAERLQAERITLLDADDVARERHRVAIRTARERAEDAGLFVVELRKRHAAAERAEEQARRQAIYGAARKQVDAAARAMGKEYPAAARKLLEVLRTAAVAQIAAEHANRELPEGAAPVGSVEDLAITGSRRQDVSSTEVERWCFEGTSTPVFPQDRVVDRSGASGKKGLGVLTSGPNAVGNTNVELKRFRRTEYLPETIARWRDPIIGRVALPGFIVPDDFAHMGVDIGQALASIEAALAQKPESEIAPPRKVHVELVPLATVRKDAA